MGQNVTSHPGAKKSESSRAPAGSRSKLSVHRSSSPYRPIPVRASTHAITARLSNEHSFVPYIRANEPSYAAAITDKSPALQQLKMPLETTAAEDTRERHIRSAAMYSQLLTNYCFAHSCFARARENLTSSLGELQQFRESDADVKAYFAGPVLELLAQDYTQIQALAEASCSSEKLRQAEMRIEHNNSEIYRLKAELEALRKRQSQDESAAESKIKYGEGKALPD